MADYISREVAIARLTELEIEKPDATMADARRVLADMPAADVIEVVRCKDCIYARDRGFAFGGEWYGSMFCVLNGPHTTSENDFCSHRKNEGKEKLKMILDILNLLILIEWALLGLAVWTKSRSLYRRASDVLDALESEPIGINPDDLNT